MAEIPMPTYENMSQNDLILITARGVNALQRDMKDLREELKRRSAELDGLKADFDHCPTCQNPDHSQGISKGLVPGLVILGAGAGAGIAEAIKWLAK